MLWLKVIHFWSFVLFLNENYWQQRRKGGSREDKVHPSISYSRYLRHSKVCCSQSVEPEDQPVTQNTLWDGITKLNTELKGNGRSCTGQTDSNNEENVEGYLESIAVLKGNNLLCDECGDCADNATDAEQDYDGNLHLLPKEVHEGGNEDAGSHCTEADGNAQGGGPCLRQSQVHVLVSEQYDHGALPHLDQSSWQRVDQCHQPTVPVL